MKRPQFTIRLPRWHEWLIYAVVALLLLSGVAWLLFDRFGKVSGEFGPEPNPALPWLLLVHGTASYAFTIIGAMLVSVHMRLGWSSGRNRPSGLVLVAFSLFLLLTGLALYYSTGEQMRAIVSLSHWVIGLTIPLQIIVHIVGGKDSASNKGIARQAKRPTRAGTARSDAAK
jgi:hypothetical protein